jgi:hypothetical protein
MGSIPSMSVYFYKLNKQSWSFLVSPGQSWSVPVIPGQSWSVLVSPGHSWSVPVSPGQSWSFLVSPGQSQSVLVSPGQSWSVPQDLSPGDSWYFTRNCVIITRNPPGICQELPAISSHLAEAQFLEDSWRIPGLPGRTTRIPPGIRGAV